MNFWDLRTAFCQSTVLFFLSLTPRSRVETRTITSRFLQALRWTYACRLSYVEHALFAN
jgi:hypothetical protein